MALLDYVPDYPSIGIKAMKKLALLGNFYGVVKPWYLPADWVLVRIAKRNKLSLSIAKNSNTVPNIYGMMVYVQDWKVLKYIDKNDNIE